MIKNFTSAADHLRAQILWLSIGAGLAVWLASGLLYAETTNQLPHLVLFLADDHGASDAGCYGNSIVRTPHLDRLAKRPPFQRHSYLT